MAKQIEKLFKISQMILNCQITMINIDLFGKNEINHNKTDYSKN